MTKNSANANGITQGVIWKQMLLFFLPIVAGTLLQQVYTMVDTVIIGRYVGTAALAAVGGSDVMVINLLVNFFVALSSGASIVISQRYGAGDNQAVEKAVHTAILLALVIGAVMTVLGILRAESLLGMMNTPADAMEYAVVYLQYYFLGMIPSMIYNMGSGILRAVGDARHPLYFLMACTVANVVLDLLFVVVWDLGVMGAAVATSLSQVICAILVIGCLCREKEGCWRLDRKMLRFDGKILRAMLLIGIPAGMQTIFYNVTNVMVQSAINSLGTVSAAAWSTFWRMDGFYWPISNSLGIAIMTFVGQNYGARKTERISQTVRTGMVIHVSMSILFGILLYLGRMPFVRLFTQDSQVQLQGALIVAYLAAAYPTFSCIEVFSSAIRGTGNAIWPTLITLVTVCFLRIGFLLVVTFPHTTHLTISLCYPVTWIVSSVVYVIYYRSGKWMPPMETGRAG